MKKGMAFLLTLLALWSLAGCVPEAVPEAAPNALLPVVQVDGVIYGDTGIESTVTDRKEGFDGKITSTVKGSEMPTKDDESNFGAGFGYQFGEREGTIEICFDTGWWIFATEEVRHQLQFPEQYIVVDRPPALIVNYGQAQIKARISLANWEFTMEDGMISALMGDGSHPLDAPNTSPFLQLNQETAPEAWLHWEIMPDVVTVKYWDEACWEDLEAEPIEEFRLMESNEVGDSYLLHLKSGNYIYEVIATWHNAPNFGGTVHYSFHTET